MRQTTAPPSSSPPTGGGERAAPAASPFLTDHLALAAFLVSRGHDAALQPSGSTKVLFAFEQMPALAEDLAAFTSGSARVDPVSYDAARVRLRKRIDALLGGGR
jgi:hypothetical protein